VHRLQLIAFSFSFGAVAAESVIVLKGVGVLLVSRQRWGGSSSRFLDGQDIHSVFIHEVKQQQQLQQQ
jgi:hypothetical protein